MSLYEYLELQPIEPQEDGSLSELDQFEQDDVIDLSHDEDGATIERMLDEMAKDFHENNTSSTR